MEEFDLKKVATKTLRDWLKGYNDCDKTITADAEHNGVLISFNVRTRLTLDEQSTFVRRVTESCFDALNNYHPEYYMPMFAATAVQLMTDLPALGVSGAANELDVDAMSNVFWECGILNIDDADLKKTIDKLRAACESAIEWRKQRILAEDSNRELNAAARSVRELVDALMKKADEVDVEGLMKYASEIAKKTNGLAPDELVKGVIEFGAKKTGLGTKEGT